GPCPGTSLRTRACSAAESHAGNPLQPACGIASRSAAARSLESAAAATYTRSTTTERSWVSARLDPGHTRSAPLGEWSALSRDRASSGRNALSHPVPRQPAALGRNAVLVARLNRARSSRLRRLKHQRMPQRMAWKKHDEPPSLGGEGPRVTARLVR